MLAPLRCALAGLLDALLSCATLGASALLSSLLLLALPRARRRTAGQLLAGVYCSRERLVGPAQVRAWGEGLRAHEGVTGQPPADAGEGLGQGSHVRTCAGVQLKTCSSVDGGHCSGHWLRLAPPSSLVRLRRCPRM